MFTIFNEYTYTQEIKKSTFLTYLAPIASSKEANQYLQKLRKMFPDATHHCYSYIIGESNNEYKYSDDGEPNQTAGIIIYDVLRKNDLTNIICVVIRFFGGIKLGAGGLVRAYSSSASGAVSLAKISKLIHYQHLKITINYQYINPIQKLLDKYENLEKTFLDKVILIYKIPDYDIKDLTSQLINLTSNNIKIEVY